MPNKGTNPIINFASRLTKKQLLITLITGSILLLLLIIWGISAIIHTNQVNHTYIVKGVDVSAYQGDIDWSTLEDQGVYFAFIKATEGEDYTDEKFEENWKNIESTGIRRGAYMFWQFGEDGDKQAQYFIKTVSAGKNDLPPVIDLELYGDYLDNPLDKDQVIANLTKTVQALKKNYDKDPIIYTNYLTYNTYLKDEFEDLNIWICDLDDVEPSLSGDHTWTFWQYSQRGILNGYEGSERFIDMNLYNGTLKEFYENF